jgi:hypothetical protein
MVLCAPRDACFVSLLRWKMHGSFSTVRNLLASDAIVLHKVVRLPVAESQPDRATKCASLQFGLVLLFRVYERVFHAAITRAIMMLA